MVSALLSRCLVLVLGTLYPAYRSYKAIKNKDVKEHVKWMMYWIVFALFTTLETFLDIFFSWFPFYYEIKILFILWVLSPATRGSSLLYKKLVHPMLISREKEIDELIEKTKQQGYSTFLQLFSSGFQYASNLFLHSAVKGQLLLGNQLKKSLSLNDVYDANTGQSQDNLYMKKMHETINEEEESSDYEDNSDKFKLLANKPVYNHTVSAPGMPTTGAAKPARKPTSTTTTSNTFNSANIRDYEIIDDDDIDSNRKQLLQANRRRASSKQLASAGSTASNYKSNEASHFGTITRAKVSKTKVAASSTTTTTTAMMATTAQTNFDNDS